MNMGIRRKKDILELVSKRKKETKQQVTSYKLGGVNKMKTMLRFLVMFAVAAIAVTLIWGTTAFAQVSSFPYSYDFETGGAQNPINADSGKWTSAAEGGAVDWQQLTTGGTSGGSAYLAGYNGNNKSTRLRVQLNTSGKTFDGSSETYTFFTKRDSSGSLTARDNATVAVEYSTNGGSTWTVVTSSTMSAYLTSTSYTFKTVTLPAGMGNQSSVYLAIRITTNAQGSNNNIDNIFVDDAFIGGGALPIQLASTAAYVIRDNDVEVAWKTVSETNNYGFEIYRRRGESSDWTKIGFVEGHGTTLTSQSYSYTDRSVSFGKYYYRIKQVDLDGQSTDYPGMEVTVGTGPDRFVLAQNYPNPFNPSTLIDFVVPQNGPATMKVYNVVGQEVATLFDGNADAGRIYTARFNASSLPSGLYFYTLKSAGQSETKRMLLTK